MAWAVVVFLTLGVVLSACAFLVFISFYRIFYSPRKKQSDENCLQMLEGEAYDPYREKMSKLMGELDSMSYTDVSTVSYDGLALKGKYYERKNGAPVDILFHGYRGSAQRDFCGVAFCCFALGHNVLMVDQRACGRSEGRVITFGVKESRDCETWINFVVNEIDKNAKIMLVGISMGAATVMNAAGRGLPECVVGVIADCGYTSAKDIIKKVMRDNKLPDKLFYVFARLGAILLGHFDPESISPIKAMRSCKVPMLFFHGDSDGYVPCNMSKENFEACASEKKQLVIVEGADHGLCFTLDMENYFSKVKSFFGDDV